MNREHSIGDPNNRPKPTDIPVSVECVPPRWDRAFRVLQLDHLLKQTVRNTVSDLRTWTSDAARSDEQRDEWKRAHVWPTSLALSRERRLGGARRLLRRVGQRLTTIQSQAPSVLLALLALAGAALRPYHEFLGPSGASSCRATRVVVAKEHVLLLRVLTDGGPCQEILLVLGEVTPLDTS
jgi:hypothetical protein